MIARSFTLGHVVLVSSNKSLSRLVVQPLRSQSVMVTVLDSWEDMEYVLCQIKPDVVAISSSLIPRDWNIVQRSSLNKSRTPIVMLTDAKRPASTLVIARMNVVLTAHYGEEPVALVSMITCLLDDIQACHRPRVINQGHSGC